ncbi:LADA_0G15632g1_1 [Lachancea dasiensis]|uniref:LADA_0G15632g1_1 n=1 Tax=Lachancea dasiensis TaxID=1072105 RepID=A0A1G4JWI5_9SACH|nr:LADA_0G15632g1_1 [Lachancea dasiensis]
MGVPAFWELIKDHQSVQRIPFQQFVTEFQHAEGRAPRLAIDAFGWLFECGFLTGETDELIDKGYRTDGLAILAFLKRLKILLSLDVTFVLVFDGPFKPKFKNELKLKRATSDKLDVLTAVNVDIDGWTNPSSPENEVHDVEGLRMAKKLLTLMNISWLDAAGEGEAECARLQKLGLVDYVVTNDSDVFAFGATRALRNMSKFWEDLPASYADATRKKDHKENFVTMIDISRISCWNQDHILLYYALLGADYSQGVRGLGSRKSATLAQLREPNFASEFKAIFADASSSAELRRPQYLDFQQRMFNHCRCHSVELFGRNYFKTSGAAQFQGWPSEEALLHYFHPTVSEQVQTDCLNGEYNNISGKFNIPESNIRQLFDLVNELDLKIITDISKWFHDIMHTTFLLKKILHGSTLPDDQLYVFKITDNWISNICNGTVHLDYWRIRYNSFMAGVEEPQSEAFTRQEGESDRSDPNIISRRKSPTKKQADREAYRYMTSVPSAMLPSSNLLVKRYMLESHKGGGKTPRKKRITSRCSSIQKNNLDEFLKKHSSPRKKLTEDVIETPLLPPTKRKLFVEDDNKDLEPEVSDWADTSSLIIVSEQGRKEDPGVPPKSPERMHMFGLSAHLDESSELDENESPLKKRNISTRPRSQGSESIPLDIIDLTHDGQL